MAYACEICLSVCRSPDLAFLSGWRSTPRLCMIGERVEGRLQAVCLNQFSASDLAPSPHVGGLNGRRDYGWT